MILKLNITNLIGRLVWGSFFIVSLLISIVIFGIGLYFISLALNFIILEFGIMTLFEIIS